MTTNNDEISFLDADEYSPTPQAAVTFEQVVINQIKKCIEEGSKEMKGGYYKEKHTKNGIMEIYVENQQEIYINSINSLYDLLLPHFDDTILKENDEKCQVEQFKTLLKKAKDNIDELLKKQIQFLKENPTINTEKRVIELEFMLNTGYIEPNSYEAKVYTDEKLKAYRYLLQSLIQLYARKRYLMAEVIDDERDA